MSDTEEIHEVADEVEQPVQEAKAGDEPQEHGDGKKCAVFELSSQFFYYTRLFPDPGIFYAPLRSFFSPSTCFLGDKMMSYKVFKEDCTEAVLQRGFGKSTGIWRLFGV